jgi:uncharacterized FlaG/YvyC family protein
MASDGIPVNVSVTRPVHGSQAPKSAAVQHPSGKPLPPTGHAAAATASAQASERAAPAKNADPAQNTAPAKNEADLHAVIAQVNKFLNDSGRPIQYRVDASSGHNMIQEINPATGDVIGEISAVEFPSLARSLGVSGLLIDSRA